MTNVLWYNQVYRITFIQGRPVRVKHDTKMHHGQSKEAKKKNENRGKLKNVDEIGGNMQYVPLA